MKKKKYYNNWSNSRNMMGIKMVNSSFRKLLDIVLLTTFVCVIFFLNPQSVVSATCPPEICFQSDVYSFDDGGPFGIPVILEVNDDTKIGNGKVEVSVTSSVDPDGIKLTLNEVSPGEFRKKQWMV